MISFLSNSKDRQPLEMTSITRLQIYLNWDRHENTVGPTGKQQKIHGYFWMVLRVERDLQLKTKQIQFALYFSLVLCEVKSQSF